MTVKELIDRLKTMPEDMDVYAFDAEEGYYMVAYVTNEKILLDRAGKNDDRKQAIVLE